MKQFMSKFNLVRPFGDDHSCRLLNRRKTLGFEATARSIHITKCEKIFCVCVYYQTPLPFLARFGSNFEQSYE